MSTRAPWTDIEVLYGSVCAAPTVTQGICLRARSVAYYPFVNDARRSSHLGRHAREHDHDEGVTASWLEMTATPTGLCVCGRVSTSGKAGTCSTTAVTQFATTLQDQQPTVEETAAPSCSRGSPRLRRRATLRIRQLQWRHDVGGGRITGVLPGEFCAALRVGTIW